MRIKASSNNKGGCGKTFILVSVASELARRGRKALVIDGDPHPSATFNLRYGLKEERVRTLYDVLIGAATFDEAVEETEYSGLYILRGDKRVKDLNGVLGMDKAAKNLAEQIKASPIGFDYAFLDTQPSASAIRDDLMMMADDVIIPLFAEGNSIAGLVEQIKEYSEWSRKKEALFGNRGLGLEGVVITNYNDKFATHRNTLPDIQKTLESKRIPLLGVVPVSGAASNASETGVPIPWQGRMKTTSIYKAFQSMAITIEKGAGNRTTKKPILTFNKNEFSGAIEI